MKMCMIDTQNEVIGIEFIPEGESVTASSKFCDYPFHIYVKKCWAYLRAIVHSILEVISFSSTFEAECLVQAFQKSISSSANMHFLAMCKPSNPP